MKTTQTRRQFIQTGGLLTIGFTLGGALSWQNANAETPINAELPSDKQINAWLQILEDGRVKVLTGKMELGQGILTAVKQVAAEELNCDMSRVTVHMADTDVTPN